MERVESSDNRQDALTMQLALSEQLKQKHLLHTPAVEAAFRTIPRHFFAGRAT